MNAKRISRRAAEQMLGGRSAGHQGPLTDLLAAASAPGRCEELVGEEKVMSAFQEAFSDGPKLDLSSAAPRRGAHRGVKTSPLPAVLSRRSARAWTIRGFGVVLAVGAVGGVAIASGGVPGRNPVGTPKKATPTMSAPTLTRKQAPPPPAPHPSASPSLADLCRELIDGESREQLEPLIKAAGGRQKALAYCKALVGGQGGALPEDWPKDWRDWTKDWPTSWPWPTGSDRTDKPRKPGSDPRPGGHKPDKPGGHDRPDDDVPFWEQPRD